MSVHWVVSTSTIDGPEPPTGAWKIMKRPRYKTLSRIKGHKAVFAHACVQLADRLLTAQITRVQAHTRSHLTSVSCTRVLRIRH